MFDMQTLVLFVIAEILTAGAVYAAIRSDLREALVRLAMHEKRLDKLDEKHCSKYS